MVMMMPLRRRATIEIVAGLVIFMPCLEHLLIFLVHPLGSLLAMLVMSRGWWWRTTVLMASCAELDARAFGGEPKIDTLCRGGGCAKHQ